MDPANGFYRKQGGKIHHPLPIPSMYNIFTYMYHNNQLNVGKYPIYMDPMG